MNRIEKREKIVMSLLKKLNYSRILGKLYWNENCSRTIDLGKEAGTVSNIGYRIIYYMGTTISSHTVIWYIENGKFPDRHIDHINGIRDDNRIENLRDVSRLINSRNRIESRKRAGMYGIKLDRRLDKNPWIAESGLAGKENTIGYFDCPVKAAIAVREYESQFLGKELKKDPFCDFICKKWKQKIHKKSISEALKLLEPMAEKACEDENSPLGRAILILKIGATNEN